MTGEPLLIGTQPVGRRVEVCRSFARKLSLENYGGPRYESVDFFASRKAECDEAAQAEVSEQLFAECEAEVLQAANDYVRKIKAQRAKQEAA